MAGIIFIHSNARVFFYIALQRLTMFLVYWPIELRIHLRLWSSIYPIQTDKQTKNVQFFKKKPNKCIYDKYNFFSNLDFLLALGWIYVGIEASYIHYMDLKELFVPSQATADYKTCGETDLCLSFTNFTTRVFLCLFLILNKL